MNEKDEDKNIFFNEQEDLKSTKFKKKLKASGDNLNNLNKIDEKNNHPYINTDNSLYESKRVIGKEHNKKLKILIVDDNQFINDSLKKLLEKIISEAKKDFEIIQVIDGIDMIKHIVDDQTYGNSIKCILTDENMEYINGSEAIRILRSLEKKNKIKNTKIISISCQEDNFSVKVMLDAGADRVLGKPISKTLIMNTLKDLKVL